MTDVDTVVRVGQPEADHAAFDEATHTWTVRGRRARVVIAIDGGLPRALACRVTEFGPYLGVAVHGAPNYFLITGPDSAAQKAYIAKCLAYLSRTGSTRIEVRAGTQRIYHERVRARGRVRRGGHYWRKVGSRIPSSFEVGSLGDGSDGSDAVYDGPATLVVADHGYRARVRLTGHINPIDGQYHWQGMIFDTAFDLRLPQDVIVVVDDRPAEARLTERTSPSTYSVVGVGAPPFALADIEVDVPVL